MTEAVIVALITGLVAMIGNVVSALSSSRLTSYKIDELKEDFADLKERVNKHNQLVERMTIVEQSVKHTNERVDALEGGEH